MRFCILYSFKGYIFIKRKIEIVKEDFTDFGLSKKEREKMYKMRS